VRLSAAPIEALTGLTQASSFAPQVGNSSGPPPRNHNEGWAMGSTQRRRDVVYVQYRINGTVIPKVLDLVYADGGPMAVVTWVMRDGIRWPSDYTKLNADLLRATSPAGSFWYDGVIESM
jgi:hypothetical protein